MQPYFLRRGSLESGPDLSGQVALITGAAGALGSAVARRLARQGARLALVDVDVARLTELVDELRAAGVEARPFAADLLDDMAIDSMVAEVEASLESVDLLVSSAGVEINAAFHTVSIEELDVQLGLHLRGPMLLTRRILPGLRQRGCGHIVVISSMSGKVPLPVKAPYAAAKAGSIAFCHSLRRELEGTGIAVSVITPSVVSGEGQAARAILGTSVVVPRALGTVTADQVADEVMGVLQTRKGEVAVSAASTLLVSALQAAAPAVVDRLLRVSGVGDFWASVAREKGRA